MTEHPRPADGRVRTMHVGIAHDDRFGTARVEALAAILLLDDKVFFDHLLISLPCDGKVMFRDEELSRTAPVSSRSVKTAEFGADFPTINVARQLRR